MINYQSGKKNDKANAFTRKPNKQFTNNEDKQCKHNVRMLLSPNQIDHEAELQPIEKSEEDYAYWTNSDINSNVSDKISPLSEQVIKSNQNNELCGKICSYFANLKELNKLNAYLKSLRMENKLLMKEHWL